jgi:ribonuclease HI
VTDDFRALKLYIDGSALKNPGGSGGFACVAEYPEPWNRPDELIFQKGFHETTNNRMELCACICALEYVTSLVSERRPERVLIVTDSLYVYKNQNMPQQWRRDHWKNRYGKPIDNWDLWKRFLSVRGAPRIRTEIIWKKGKKSPILNEVDRAAKLASKNPTKDDRGFRTGKVARSKVKGGSSVLYPAQGQEEIIRIYRSAVIGKIDHKIYFDVFDQKTRTYKQKCSAYVPFALRGDFHRQNCYRVKFCNEPQYPVVIAKLEDIKCAELGSESVD